MLTVQMMQKASYDATLNFQKVITKINRVTNAIQKIEETGLELAHTSGDLEYPIFHVKRTDLPTIRKVVGRVKITNRSVPWNHNTTHEIVVYLKPIKEEFNDLEFHYRTPYRGGGKCHIETVISNSTYQTLVCKK